MLAVFQTLIQFEVHTEDTLRVGRDIVRKLGEAMRDVRLQVLFLVVHALRLMRSNLTATPHTGRSCRDASKGSDSLCRRQSSEILGLSEGTPNRTRNRYD